MTVNLLIVILFLTNIVWILAYNTLVNEVLSYKNKEGEVDDDSHAV